MKKLLDFYRSTNKYVNDAFDRIIVDIHLKKRENGFKSFMLTGCEPGVGTTTLSINIAISMAVSGWKTILLDGDIRKITEYKRLNADVEKGLSEYLSSKATYEQIVYETNYDKLNYIPGGRGSDNPVSLLCSGRLDSLIGQLIAENDYVIVDMPAVTTSVDTNILANKVDSTILVAAYADTDKKSVRKAKDILIGAGATNIGIILNKVEPSQYKRILQNFDYFNNRKYVNKSDKARKKAGKK